MFDSKAIKDTKAQDTKAQNPTSPKIAPRKETGFSEQSPSQDQIKERAYQLYKNRGGQDGLDQQDWLDAEEQILKRQPVGRGNHSQAA